MVDRVLKVGHSILQYSYTLTELINTLVQQNLHKTKKTWKAAKAGKNKGNQPAARGSKAKKKNNSSKKKVGGSKTKAKESSSSTKEKEDSVKEKDKDEPCKSITIESFTSCHPSYLGWYGQYYGFYSSEY